MAEDPMDVLRRAERQKEFGSYFHASPVTAGESGMFDRAVEKLAIQLREAAVLAGQKPVFGSERLIETSAADSPLRSVATIGATIRTTMSSSPQQFVCFAAFKMEELRQELDAAKVSADNADARMRRMMDLFHDSESLVALRTALDSFEAE